MSFTRTKFGGFHDKSARPSTAVTPVGLRPTSSSHKSFIPKFRSLSQPPSADSIKDSSRNSDDMTNSPTTKKVTEEMEVGATDHSVTSEEFKDCLDTKSESAIIVVDTNNNEPKTDLPQRDVPQTLKETANERIIVVNKRPSTAAIKKDNVSVKNSSSGIPVSVSVKGSSRMSPKPSPRLPRSSSVVKKLSSPSRSSPPAECKANHVQIGKKNLELFLLKKKRFEQLKKDILDKQKPAFELYQTLQQLKKKLDDTGKPVVLDPFKLIECDDLTLKTAPRPDLSAGGETPQQTNDVDPTVLTSMKNIVSEIPQGLQNICEKLIEKRNKLLEILEKCMDPSTEKDALQTEIEKIKSENGDLDLDLDCTFKLQQQHIEALVSKWAVLSNHADDPTNAETLKELQLKLKKQEVLLKEMTAELHKAKLQLKERPQVDESLFEEEIAKLREKTDQLDKQLDAEKKKHQHELERYKSNELSIKTFKSKIKDFDTNKAHSEIRITQLSQDLRSSQLKMKQMEKSYEKEIAELNKSRHLDKSVIERMNKDRSTFETRLQTSHENAENMEHDFKEREAQLLNDLEVARNNAEISHSETLQLKKECELYQKQVHSLEAQCQQTADMMIRKKEHIDKPETDRECELQIEIVAQRAAIRALQEKVEANTAEKLRFIETIEKMNGTPEGMNDTIVKALVKREEDITKYDLLLKRNDEVISKQKMEIDTLYVKQEHLLRQIEGMDVEDTSDDLKHMLKEGKSKLEQALQKSLENENKIIKYEHEIGQKNQAIANLENMMKVRDGLIGVIKVKKDELSMENNSLTKYSEKIRTCVLESKEELKEKSEIIQELQLTVNAKQKETHKLDRKIRDLEEKLTMTNEKRYKLQETITFMEKELQATKAQMNQFKDMQTRYELGTISDSSDKSKIGLYPWTKTCTKLFEQYKEAYDNEQKLRQYKSEMNTIHKNHLFLTNGPSTLYGESEYTPSKLESDANSAPVITANSSYEASSGNYEADLRFSNVGDTLANNKADSAVALENSGNKVFGSGREYKPILFKGIDRYRVLNKGNVMWCQPSYEMQMNNSLITKDLIAHTCPKIKHTFRSSSEYVGQEINFSDPADLPVKIKITVV